MSTDETLTLDVRELALKHIDNGNFKNLATF
jgi:hypothetical protein